MNNYLSLPDGGKEKHESKGEPAEDKQYVNNYLSLPDGGEEKHESKGEPAEDKRAHNDSHHQGDPLHIGKSGLWKDIFLTINYYQIHIRRAGTGNSLIRFLSESLVFCEKMSK